MSQRSQSENSSSISSQQQNQQQPDPNKTTYTVAVKTTDKFGAGTDANVYVQIVGTKSTTKSIQLKNSLNHRNKFERNHSDVFIFPNMDSIGEIRQMKIWHDNSGIGAAWHLENVDVHDAKTNTIYRFPCDRWLSKTDDDGLLCRLLNCTSKRQKVPKHFRMQEEKMQQCQQQQQQQQPGQPSQSSQQIQTQSPNQYQAVLPKLSRLVPMFVSPQQSPLVRFEQRYHPNVGAWMYPYHGL